MTAPAATARGTPAGIPLFDGFSTKITLAANPTVSFWEKDAQPPAYDGGDPIDITTMHNVLYRTKAHRALIDIGDVQSKAAYDPNVLTQILSLVNVDTTITVTHPDGSTEAHYGFMRSFTRDTATEGAQPEATVVMCVTNYDHTAHAEAPPTIASVSGT